jgi:type II secretory pathway component PulF
VPELLAWMVGIGEQRGNLATALRQGADLYRRQADLRAGLLRTVFPPLVVLIASGVLVALFALAILLPLVRLLEGLSK